MAVEYREVEPVGSVADALVALSADWAVEASCHGYAANDAAYFARGRVWVALDGGDVVGYLLAYPETQERRTSVLDAGAKKLVIDEIFVRADRRSCGIGRGLFELAENAAREDGCDALDLVTATKDHRKILHFYIDELGMEFWSARLFKKL